MLITTIELKALYGEFSAVSDELLKRKLGAVENAIIAYTRNNFTNRYVNEVCHVESGRLVYDEDKTHYLAAGDTVRIGGPKHVVGVFSIQTADSTGFTVDGSVYCEGLMNARKVEYPVDVVEGAINILRWDLFERDKHEGIASETISRHSVSYETLDGANTVNGYPLRLFGFCSPYMNRVRT